MSQTGRPADEHAKAEARAAERKRLAVALRANLRRRKLSTAERAETEATPPVETEAGTE